MAEVVELKHDCVELFSVSLSFDFQLESARQVEVLGGNTLCPFGEDLAVGCERTRSMDAVDVAAKCEKVPEADELAVGQLVSELLEGLEDTGELGPRLVLVCQVGDEEVPEHERVIDAESDKTGEDLTGTGACSVHNGLGNVEQKRLDIVVVWDGHRLDRKLVWLQKIFQRLGHFWGLVERSCFCVFYKVLAVCTLGFACGWRFVGPWWSEDDGFFFFFFF